MLSRWDYCEGLSVYTINEYNAYDKCTENRSLFLYYSRAHENVSKYDQWDSKLFSPYGTSLCNFSQNTQVSLSHVHVYSCKHGDNNINVA